MTSGGKKCHCSVPLSFSDTLETVSPILAEVTWQGIHKFLHLLHPTIFCGRSLKGGRKRIAKGRDTPSFLPLLPRQDIPRFPPLSANTSCSVNSHVTGALRHAAAGAHLRLLFFHWLSQFEEGWITAGRRVVNRIAVGGDQRHAGVLRADFGISEGVCGAVT